MTDCHEKLQFHLIFTLCDFILLFTTVFATDGSNCDISDNVRSKREDLNDKVLLLQSSNPDVDEEMSQVAQEDLKRAQRDTKLNFEKDSASAESDADLNDDTEQEEDDIDTKGLLSHSISDRNTRRRAKSRSGPKMWDHWGKWTSCSVSCGVGKMTRWRHCVTGGCAAGEKEAQIKTCTLAAC